MPIKGARKSYLLTIGGKFSLNVVTCSSNRKTDLLLVCVSWRDKPDPDVIKNQGNPHSNIRHGFRLEHAKHQIRVKRKKTNKQKIPLNMKTKHTRPTELRWTADTHQQLQEFNPEEKVAIRK